MLIFLKVGRKLSVSSFMVWFILLTVFMYEVHAETTVSETIASEERLIILKKKLSVLQTQQQKVQLEIKKIEFHKWLNNFQKKAVKKGIKLSTLKKNLSNVNYLKKIISQDQNQVEFSNTFWFYYLNKLDESFVKKGRNALKENILLLSKVQAKTGIPKHYLVAFWGMETIYGNFFGSYPLFDTLSTLAFDKRRNVFFEKQLISALRLVQNNKIPTDNLVSSWAGAMGNMQFIPTTIEQYAIDADNDGKYDLTNSLEDAFYSAGNYLQKSKWQKGFSWGREVILPKKFKRNYIKNKSKRSINFWIKLGVRDAYSKKLQPSKIKARIIAPDGLDGATFMVYHNFEVIKRWNNSDRYALNIGLLANMIIGKDGIIKNPPRKILKQLKS